MNNVPSPDSRLSCDSWASSPPAETMPADEIVTAIDFNTRQLFNEPVPPGVARMVTELAKERNRLIHENARLEKRVREMERLFAERKNGEQDNGET